MEIHAANGKLMLSIPIQHLGYDGHQNYKDVQIANEFPWQRNHWLSLKPHISPPPFLNTMKMISHPLPKQYNLII